MPVRTWVFAVVSCTLMVFIGVCAATSRQAFARITHGALPPAFSSPTPSSPFHYPAHEDAAGWKSADDGNFGDCTWSKIVYAGAGDSVPAILVEPAGAGAVNPAPVLLLIHGLGSRKEDLLPVARLAAQDGYASLLIDLPGFGERKPAALPTPATVGQLTSYIRSMLVQSVDDLGAGIGYLLNRPELDRTRIGVLGISLGSFIAADLAAVDPRIKVAILISSGGGLGDILEYQQRAFVSMGSANRVLLAQTNAAKLDHALIDVDPLTYVGRIAPRPILMINGGADRVIPPSAAQRLYAAARQPKQINWFPGEGHIPSPLGMYASIKDFLQLNFPA